MPTKIKLLSGPKNENESHLCLYHRTSLRFSCKHNIFGPTQMAFLERKRKIVQNWKKIIFARNEKIRKLPNSPFSAPKTKMNFGRLLVWWLDLSDPDPSDFTTDLRHCWQQLFILHFIN